MRRAHPRLRRAAGRGRADQRAVRHQGRRGVRARGESARAPARCRSSPRRPACRSPSLAAAVMVGETLDELGPARRRAPALRGGEGGGVPVQQAPGRGPRSSGPEMRSTGEVMGIADSFGMAFAKAQISADGALPLEGAIFVTVNDHDKANVVPIARRFHGLGFRMLRDRGHGAVPARARHPGRAGAQGARGPAQRHRPAGLGRDPAADQHAARQAHPAGRSTIIRRSALSRPSRGGSMASASACSAPMARLGISVLVEFRRSGSSRCTRVDPMRSTSWCRAGSSGHNTPLGKLSQHDDYAIRRAALQHRVPYTTTLSGRLRGVRRHHRAPEPRGRGALAPGVARAGAGDVSRMDRVSARDALRPGGAGRGFGARSGRTSHSRGIPPTESAVRPPSCSRRSRRTSGSACGWRTKPGFPGSLSGSAPTSSCRTRGSTRWSSGSGKGLDHLRQDGDLWTVGAGLPAPLAARRTTAAGFAGLHIFVGVPGTVGGGVYMNAGCHGGDWSEVVQRVTVVDASGQRHGGPAVGGPIHLPAQRARRADRARDRRPAAAARSSTGSTKKSPRCSSGGSGARRSTSRAAAACSRTRRARAGSRKAVRARRVSSSRQPGSRDGASVVPRCRRCTPTTS